jgi:hypothetical protein
MLHKEWIEYLKRENKSKHFDEIKHYYMPRKLRRFIQIDRKLLEMKKDENFKDEKTGDFIIVYTEKEFNEKCRQNPKIKNIIHFFLFISRSKSIKMAKIKWTDIDSKEIFNHE